MSTPTTPALIPLALLAALLSGCSRPVEPKVTFSFENSLDDGGPLHLKGSPGKEGKLDYVEGIKGKAVEFSGGALIQVTPTGLDLSRGTSIECWLKTKEIRFDSFRGLELVALGNLVDVPAGFRGNIDLGLEVNPQREAKPPRASAAVAFANGGRGVTADKTPMPANQWVHLAMVFDPASKRLALYQDGDLAQEITDITQPVAPFTMMRMGQDLPGAIDEVRIFDQPISASQIKADAKK